MMPVSLCLLEDKSSSPIWLEPTWIEATLVGD